MKRVAWVFSGFQTHSDRCRYGTETVQVGRERVGRVRGAGRSLRVRGGSRYEFSNSCGCWAGRV